MLTEFSMSSDDFHQSNVSRRTGPKTETVSQQCEEFREVFCFVLFCLFFVRGKKTTLAC